jgi:RHS repeat-associated protein
MKTRSPHSSDSTQRCEARRVSQRVFPSALLRVLCASAFIWLSFATVLHAQLPTNLSSAEKITRTRVFSQPITYTTAELPGESQSLALWLAIESFKTAGVSGGIGSLEAFIANNPNSPWTPSLRANLGKYYLDRGRYTLALEHWEQSWAATKNLQTPGGVATADFTLAHWTRLLASLGRRDALTTLFTETQGRVLRDASLQVRLQATREGYSRMVSAPGVAYRCGTFALDHVGFALKGANYTHQFGPTKQSPASGFSMRQLLNFVGEAKLDLVPVERRDDSKVAVPSVVHWKQDHYAAIVAREGDLFKVVDPTFGNPRWFSKETIDAETTGYFMIPGSQFSTNDWRILSTTEQSRIFGKGYYTIFTYEYDCNGNLVLTSEQTFQTDISGPPQTCNGCQGSTFDPAKCCPRGGVTGLTGTQTNVVVFHEDANVPDSPLGMAVWSVSEPYISLWMADTPLQYNSPIHGSVSFTLNFKQNQTRPSSTNIFGFGQLWHGNTFTYLKVTDAQTNANYPYYEATLYSTDGTEREYLWSDTQPEFHSRTRMQRMTNASGGLVGFKLLFPNGNSAEYTYLRTNAVNDLEAFLTADLHISGKGNITFAYETTNNVVRLTQMIDGAGLTNTYRYDTNRLHLINEIEDPYGHKATFAYNTNDLITNITDMVNLSSSFQYHTNHAITNLTTPYGSTSFAYSNNVVEQLRDGTIQKAVIITDPVGGKQMYLYRFLHVQPGTTNNPTVEVFTPPTNPDEWDEVQHSGYWGPFQFAKLSTNNLAYLSTNDYHLGRHVLYGTGEFDSELQGFRADSRPFMTRAVSPNGVTEGHKVFYTYATGQSSPKRVWQILPDGTTNYVEYIRDATGYPTNIISTYSIGTSILTRTNRIEYDANYNIIREIGPTGTVEASYGYNASGQLLSFTNAVGDVTSYTYSTNGHVSSITRPTGLTTTNFYDTNGWLTQMVDLEISRTNTFTYTGGLLHTRVNECGLATTNTWDALGRRTSTIFPDGTTVSNIYDKLHLARTKDRLDHWTDFSYDALQRLTVVTNALGHNTWTAYCPCGSVEHLTNALGQVTTFFYDNAGRRTAVMLPDTTITSYTYDKLGRLVSITDAENRSTTNYFNNQGLTVAVSNALGRLVSIVYDVEDRATNQVDANGISISMTYDDLGRVLTRTYPDSGVEKFGYGARGLLSHTNQLGKVTRYGYDPAGRKTAETNANSEVVRYTYSSSGDLLSLTDGKNQVTQWQYDEYCRQTNKLDATTNSIFQYKYDANGRLTNRWTPAKGNTAYRYDAGGNLTNVTHPTSPSLQFSHDALDRLTNMVDAVGTTRYTYTTTGRLESEDGPWADDSVTYAYHADGLRQSLSLARPGTWAWVQTYAWDVGNRLTNTTSEAGSFGYSYHVGQSVSPATLIRKLTLPGGSYITNDYDNVARLLSTQLRNSQSAILNSHAYLYNSGNQRTKQTFTDANYVDYTYDDIGQLKSAIGSESGGSPSRLHEQLGYAYDAAGNLNHRTNNALVQTFAVDSLNQLSNVTRSGTLTAAGKVGLGVPPVSVTVNNQSASLYTDQMFAKAGFSLVDGTNQFSAIATDATPASVTNDISVWLPATATFQYDTNGNLLSDGHRAFTWNDESQLIQVLITNALKSEFEYDGKHRLRVSRDYEWNGAGWTLTNEVRRIYDGFLVIQERDGSNVPLKSCTRGRDLSGSFEGAGGIGGLLALSRHSSTPGNPTRHAFYHADGNGNITALVNPEGVLVAEHHYDPYGRDAGNSGPWAALNTYRYSSKEWHAASQLVSYTYRWYDPELQRWLNRDPSEEASDRNLYRYVSNMPTIRVDPFGLVEWEDIHILDLMAVEPWPSCPSGMAYGTRIQQREKVGFFSCRKARLRIIFQFRRCVPPEEAPDVGVLV